MASRQRKPVLQQLQGQLDQLWAQFKELGLTYKAPNSLVSSSLVDHIFFDGSAWVLKPSEESFSLVPPPSQVNVMREDLLCFGSRTLGLLPIGGQAGTVFANTVFF